MQQQNENTVVHAFLKYAPYYHILPLAIKCKGFITNIHTLEKNTHKGTPALPPPPHKTKEKEK